nr:hypothetical protein B0A51_03189 [Rachicladosporium sp. CCFEE 5018]
MPPTVQQRLIDARLSAEGERQTVASYIQSLIEALSAFSQDLSLGSRTKVDEHGKTGLGRLHALIVNGKAVEDRLASLGNAARVLAAVEDEMMDLHDRMHVSGALYSAPAVITSLEEKSVRPDSHFSAVASSRSVDSAVEQYFELVRTADQVRNDLDSVNDQVIAEQARLQFWWDRDELPSTASVGTVDEWVQRQSVLHDTLTGLEAEIEAERSLCQREGHDLEQLQWRVDQAVVEQAVGLGHSDTAIPAWVDTVAAAGGSDRSSRSAMPLMEDNPAQSSSVATMASGLRAATNAVGQQAQLATSANEDSVFLRRAGPMPADDDDSSTIKPYASVSTEKKDMYITVATAQETALCVRLRYYGPRGVGREGPLASEMPMAGERSMRQPIRLRLRNKAERLDVMRRIDYALCKVAFDVECASLGYVAAEDRDRFLDDCVDVQSVPALEEIFGKDSQLPHRRTYLYDHKSYPASPGQ